MQDTIKDIVSPEVSEPAEQQNAIPNMGEVQNLPEEGQKIKRYHKGISPLMLVLGIILVIYSISLLLPMIWSLITSFKDRYEFRRNLFGLPQEWVLENYINVFKTFRVTVESGAGNRFVWFEEMFLNSLLYAVGCAFASTTVACVVAYLTSKFPYKFSKVIYTVVIVVMIIPIVGSLPSEIQMSQTLGFYDHIWGLWIMKANFLGMYFLVFYGMFKGLPDEYADAAYVDGAGNLSVLLTIIFPLVKTTYFTIWLLNFIGLWNDYQTPLVYIPNSPTMAYGLYYMFNLTSEAVAAVPTKLAACMIMLVPILVLFLIFHNRLIGNITVGGLKE